MKNRLSLKKTRSLSITTILFIIFIIYSCKDDEPVQVVANFSSDKTNIVSSGSISFSDNSTGNPTSWNWTFEGGTPSTSSAQNPTIVYETPGTYDVTLTVSNGETSDTKDENEFIFNKW